MFPKEVIHKLQEDRRKNFPTYSQITLDRGALRIISHNFINPECQSDIDVMSLKGDVVSLETLGEHVVTAAPSSLAKYGVAKGLLHLTAEDVLRYFSLEHALDVKDNKVHEKRNPYYALAHIMLVSRIEKIGEVSKRRYAHLVMSAFDCEIRFRHVVVPDDLRVCRGEMVFHHFGVIADIVRDEDLSLEIVRSQRHEEFIREIQWATAKKDIVIDFSSEEIFHRDVLGQILCPERVETIQKPRDIKNGKIIYKK